MMAKQDDHKESKSSKWYVLLGFGLWGAVGGYIGSDLITGGANGEPLLGLSLSSGLALLTGGLLLLCVAIGVIGSLSPRIGIAMSIYEDREQWEDERSLMWISGLGGVSYSAALILLALVEPLGLSGNTTVLGAFIVLAAVFLYSCFRILREYDELWLGINSESCVIAFYLTLGVGGLWAALAHLEVAPELSPLDWITLMTLASLAGTIWSTSKRGMLED